MTKRLFAYLGLTMLSVYTVVFYFGIYGICAAGLVFAGLIIRAVFIKGSNISRRVFVFIAVTVLVSTLLFSVYDGVFKSFGERYAGDTVSMTAKVNSDGVKRNGMYTYELKAERIDSEKTDIKVMLYSNFFLSCGYGDTIKVKARLKMCDDNYHRSKGFVCSAAGDEYKLDYKVLKQGETDIWHIPSEIQKSLSEAIKSVVPGSSGELCAAVAFGDRNGLSDDIDRMFTSTGLSFLIVISGLHMSIASAFLLFVLKPLGKRRFGNTIRCLITVLIIILYMLITGWTASVVRSGIAVISMVIAVAFNRRSDMYNNLGFAAFVLIVANPYAVGDTSMLLSFSSVLGIVYFFPKLYRRFEDYCLAQKIDYYNEIKRTNQRKRQLAFRVRMSLLNIYDGLIKIIFVSLSAIIASMPIVSLTIGYVNPTTILTSVILTPLVMCVLVLSLLIAAVVYIPFLSSVSYFIGAVADFASNVIISVVRIIYSADYLTLYLDRDIVWLWLSVLAVLVILAIVLKRDKKIMIAAFLLSLVFLAGCYSAKFIIHQNSVTLKIYGTASPSVSVTGGGVEALLSYGCAYDETDELLRNLHSSFGDVRTLVIPNDSLKTSRIANNIMDTFDVESVMMYHSNRTAKDTELKALSRNNYKEFYNSDIVRLNLGKGITDTIIHDGKKVWQYVDNKKTSVLIVPDKADVLRLDEKYRTADVVVCGSETENINLLGKSDTVFVTGGSNKVTSIRLK